MKTRLAQFLLRLICLCLLATSCGPIAPAPGRPVTIVITAISDGSSSSVTFLPPAAPGAAQPRPLSTAAVNTATPAPSADSPVIFTGFGQSASQTCGHGDVVSADGHVLRATPQVLAGHSNELARLPDGARVDVIDCRLWTDTQGVSWLAVRTAERKLGWLFLQDDRFNVTIYPVVGAVPGAVTGLPSGARVAYVPPSGCSNDHPGGEAVATSIGIDLLPVVGDLKGLGEAATGCDLVTGESLGNWRWLGLLGLIGLSEVALLRNADEAGDVARLADNARFAERLSGSLTYSDEAAMTLLRGADDIADLRAGLRQVDELGAARYFDDAGSLSDEAIQALAKLEQPCSFSADTPVITPGGLISISQIHPGQRVLGYAQDNKAPGWFTVTAAFSHPDPLVLRLAVEGEWLDTTPEHPFYVPGRGWVAAGHLRPGDQLAAASGGSAAITSIETRPHPQTMYNLTIAEAHTYYVGQGGWLVHNACSQILRRNLLASSDLPGWARNDEVEWQAHHLIPGQLEKHVFLTHVNGWNIDGAQNGIALPTYDADAVRLGLSAHRGSHGQYSSRVLAELDDLENSRAVEGWSDATSTYQLQALLARLRAELLSTGGRLPD